MKIKLYAALKRFTIESEVKAEDYKNVMKNSPEKLSHLDDKGTPLFTVYLGTDPKISSFGICFASVNQEGNPFSEFKIKDDVDPEKYEENIAEVCVLLKSHLDVIEAQVRNEARRLNDLKTSIINNIKKVD